MRASRCVLALLYDQCVPGARDQLCALRVARHVGLVVEHLVRRVEAAAGLIDRQATVHAHQPLDGDGAAASPAACHAASGAGASATKPVLVDQDADQRIRHRLGHREAEDRCLMP